MIEFVKAYQDAGFSFFPLPYKEKASRIKWEEYQKRLPTEDEVTRWFNGDKTNLAIVTGQISGGLVALDCDSPERYAELSETIKTKLSLTDIKDSTWITQTGRGFQIWFKVEEFTKSAKFPQLDIKAEGGYVVAPPSIHPSGKTYRFLNPKTELRTIPSLKSIGIDTAPPQATPNNPGWVSTALKGVGEGERNDMCAKLAGYFVNKHPEDITVSLLLDWNKRNTPSLPEKEVLTTVSYAYNKWGQGGQEGTVGMEGTLADRVREWVSETEGQWTTVELDGDLSIHSQADKANRKKILQRMKKNDEVRKNPSTNRFWQRIDKEAEVIDISGGTRLPPMKIRWPFHLEDLFDTRRKNIIILAGTSDAGKTAFLMNVVAMNQDEHEIWYWSSEMTSDEMMNRLDKFSDVEEWNFQARERSRNFADVVKPNAVNIIDNLEVEDYSQAENMIREIFDRIDGGICIIAMHKNYGTDIARGGPGTLAKSRLYLSMGNGRIKIIKCKNWHDPEVNPNGRVSTFKLVNGCDFRIIRPWHYED